MSEYQTVVLDRYKGMRFTGGIWPTWVTQDSGASALAFWSNEEPVYYANGVWRSDSSPVYSDTAEDCDEARDVFRDLPSEQRIARIEYRLKPAPYSDDDPTPDPESNRIEYHTGESKMTKKKLPQPGEFWRTRGGKIAMVGARDDNSVAPSMRLLGFVNTEGLYELIRWYEDGRYYLRNKHPVDLVEHLTDRTSWDDPKPEQTGDPDPEAVERLIESVQGYMLRPYNDASFSKMSRALAAVKESRK